MDFHYKVIASLEANVSKFEGGIRDAIQSITDFQRTADQTGTNFQEKMDLTGNLMSSVGAQMTKGLTVPFVAGMTASIKSASDFETAMKGVSKTVDMSEAEFEKMSQSIRDMAKEMPVAVEEIAGVAESAGQLGISKEHILDFTENMVKLGTATNMSAEEASTALAQFANITGMAETDFSRLGSAIVELGNNTATTERDIVNMGQRLASTGAMVGLTEAEIMGLSASMASVGIEAEAGGTAMSTALKKIDGAVREGGESLERFAKIAGLSAEEFASKWEEKPSEAISAFVEGLGKMSAEGGDANKALKDIGITGIRETDTLLRLAGAGELTAESFDMANKAWEENTALSKEAEEAWSSTANQAKMLWHRVNDLGIEIGSRLLPVVNKVIEFLGKALDSFSELDEGVQNAIVAFAVFASAIGPILFVVGKLLNPISKIVANFKTLGSIGGALASTFSKTATVFGLLTSPIGLTVGAVLALIGVLVYLYNTNEDVRNAINTAWESIKTAILAVVDALKPVLQFMWEDFKTATEIAWTAISGIIETSLELISGLIKAFGQVIQGDFKGAFETLDEHGRAGMETLAETIGSILDRIGENIFNKFQIITGDTSTTWEEFKQTILTKAQEAVEGIGLWFGSLPERFATWWQGVVDSTTEWVTQMGVKAQELVSGFGQKVAEFFSNLPERIGYWLGFTLATVAMWVVGMVVKAGEMGAQFIQSVATWLSTLPERVQTWLSDTIARVTTWASEMPAKAREAGRQFVDGAINFIQTLPGRIQQFLSDIINRLTSWVSNMGGKGREAGTQLTNSTVSAVAGLPGRMAEAGRNVVQGFWNGIQAMGAWLSSKVTGFFRGIVDGAKSALGIHSPSRVFDREVGRFILPGLTQGIERNLNLPAQAVSQAMQKAIDTAKGMQVTPTFSVDGQIARTNQQINSSINHKLATRKRPAVINLTLGRREFEWFVDDISEIQTRNSVLNARTI